MIIESGLLDDGSESWGRESACRGGKDVPLVVEKGSGEGREAFDAGWFSSGIVGLSLSRSIKANYQQVYDAATIGRRKEEEKIDESRW